MEKEMIQIEKEVWETLVNKLETLSQQVSLLEKTLAPQQTYYNNKDLRVLLNVEEKLIQKYRDQGLLAYTKVGDKYWYSQEDIKEFLLVNRCPAFA